MKTFALVNKRYRNNAIEIVLGGKRITVDSPNLKDLSLCDFKDYANKILIEKIAFSCNYREIGVINRTYAMMNDRELSCIGFGSEFAGRIIDLGKNVKSFNIGDRVIPTCTYSKDSNYAGIPTNQASLKRDAFYSKQLIKIPNDMPDEIAASFSIAGCTVYGMIRRLSLKKGENILITSGGSNTSLAVISALNNRNYNLYVTTSNREHFGKLKKIIENVYLLNENTRTQVFEYFNKIGGVDAVIDPFCDLHIDFAVQVLNYNGRYVTCGFSDQLSLTHKHNGIPFKKCIGLAITKNLVLNGNCLGTKKDLKTALSDYSSGTFDIIIDSLFYLGEEKAFFDRTFNSKERFGKVVFKY